jgi:prepilin-type N-terminal cleavage/methylation domain-containing protein
MIKMNTTSDSMKGFSAIELLVTLFIALLFLSIGYTLYGTIVTSSSVARHRAQADNIAFEYLRRYETTVTNPCIVTNPVNNALVTGPTAADLAGPTVTVNITCQNSTATSLSLVKVTVLYKEGGVQRNVYHEVYASTQ